MRFAFGFFFELSSFPPTSCPSVLQRFGMSPSQLPSQLKLTLADLSTSTTTTTTTTSMTAKLSATCKQEAPMTKKQETPSSAPPPPKPAQYKPPSHTSSLLSQPPLPLPPRSAIQEEKEQSLDARSYFDQLFDNPFQQLCFSLLLSTL